MKQANTANQTSFTLSDGAIIHRSPVEESSTGYLGSSFCPSFTPSVERPFQAAANRPKDLELKNHLGGKKMWLGGFYADAREAAYVSALFKADPIYMDEIITANGVHTPHAFVDFPPDLYDLPEILTQSDAAKLIVAEKHRIAEEKRIRTLVAKEEKANKKTCNSIWSEICKMYDIPALARRFGKEAVVKARNTMTLGEFKTTFELA